MTKIVQARAYANNEVAFLAWRIDSETIAGCLGFHIVREYLDEHDKVTDERPLAAYVSFKGQRNSDWQSQNTTVWPVQKFNWRDLTLRKRRDAATRRPENERVRYRIRAVGRMKAGLEPVVTILEKHTDGISGLVVEHGYQGNPIALGYLTPAAHTNALDVTTKRPPFTTSFTNGILSTQFLKRMLDADKTTDLATHLKTPNDRLREYLSGDVLSLVHGFFNRPDGRFHAALYELEDAELIALLVEKAQQLDLILSDAGSGADDEAEADENGKKPTIYDTRNAPARELLRALSKKPGAKFTLQDRLFNGSGHIGHNKFVVWVDGAGKPRSVLTGSTNWTWSGVAGQSNNCILIDDTSVAQAFLDYWKRLHTDEQAVPNPPNARATGANQGDTLKVANRVSTVIKVGGSSSIETWFSPNMPGKAQPPPKSAAPVPPPPDMDHLFSLMRKAKRAIFFLVFLPSRGGVNSIISQAIALGAADTSLDVIGAISDSQAMWDYEPAKKSADGKRIPAWSPRLYQVAGTSIIRATALTDKEIGHELGDFSMDEHLTAPGGKAIIHDKVLVIDPTDPKDCLVAFGSHNMGYKASYSNDENLVIVRGHAALAQAYAVHVLDVYDHYRFRAVEAEIQAKRQGTGTPKGPGWDGFLDTTDHWQKKSSHRLSDYFTE